MGAKAWLAAICDGDPRMILASAPALDREASRALAASLLPGREMTEGEDGTLTYLNPGDDALFVGVYGPLTIIAHIGYAMDRPSTIESQWLRFERGASIYTHATHSVSDWFAFSLWRGGELIRSLSVQPDEGVIEDIGTPLPFEVPFWSGQHKVDDEFEDDEPYPLPFHPLEFAEAAILTTLGFQFEGRPAEWSCDPDAIPIMCFTAAAKKRKKLFGIF